jgi:hypothetical protein
MPTSTLPPAFRQGPLNLNSDGTKINYKKSHVGPWKIHWDLADAEEIVRLLTSSTIRPIHFREIPMDQIVTYVNLVRVEKLNDDLLLVVTGLYILMINQQSLLTWNLLRSYLIA